MRIFERDFFYTLRIHIFAIIQDIACRVICSTNSSVADFLQVVLDNGYKAPNSCAEAVSKLFPENDRAGQVTLDIGAGTGLLAEEVSRVHDVNIGAQLLQLGYFRDQKKKIKKKTCQAIAVTEQNEHLIVCVDFFQQ